MSALLSDVEAIAICLCTCRRPVMLARCLDSLAALAIPDDFAVSLVVVDNDPDASGRLAVAQFCAKAPFPVYYVHEPVRGISRARNAALDKAAALSSDWIAFIDDDETADPDWLAILMAPEYRHLPILGGQHLYDYPDPLPFWMLRPRRQGDAQPLAKMRAVGAGNIRISAAVIHDGVRFDESRGLLGQEDDRFCLDAARLGFSIHRIAHAITRGPFHAERMTYRGIVGRHYALNASRVLQRLHDDGWARTCADELPKAALHLLAGAVVLLASPLGLLAGLTQFKKFALRGGKHLATAMSSIAVAAGHIPQHYRTIHGA